MKIKITLGLLCFVSSQICFSVTVDDLGYKSIFRNFYPNMFHVSMNDEDYEGHDLPKAGIKESGKEYLAMMYPPEEYLNANNEKRYLVYIKKREIEKNEYQLINGQVKKVQTFVYGFSDTCHVCDSARVDLMLFKQDSNGKFNLISKTAKDFKPLSSYGDVSINIKDLKNRIAKIGEDEVGFFDDSYSENSHGVTDNVLYLIRLNEKVVKGYSLGLSSGSNSGEYGDDNSPLIYEYSSTFRTIKNNDQSIYPIEIKFKGDNYNQKTRRIENFNKIKILEYNAAKDKYELINQKDY